MAIQTLNTIKTWFKTGLKPSQTQFWDTWDSFRHKYEKTPLKDIEDLETALSAKAEKSHLNEHITDENAHTELFTNKANVKHTHKIDDVIGLQNNLDNKYYNKSEIENKISVKEDKSNKTDDVAGNLNSKSYPSNIGLKTYIDAQYISVPYLGAVTPKDISTGTGEANWSATEAGTYINFGGVVVEPNSLATISRDKDGVFTMSQTRLDLSSYTKTIDVQTKADLIVGKNKFDKRSVVLGFYLDKTNIFANSAYDSSDYIKVTPLTQYVSNSNMRFTTYFDANKNYVSGGSSTSISTFITPSNVEYVKITISHTNLNTFQLEEGSVATKYENYICAVPLTQIPKLPYREDTTILPLSLNETDWAILGKNLFDCSKATDDFFVNWTNGVLSKNTIYSSSDFIKISPLTQYVSANLAHYAFYTEAKNFISGNNSNLILTTPPNAYYIRFSFLKNKISTTQLEEGGEVTSYEKYGFKAPTLNISSTAEVIKPWKNTKTNCLGDSITAGNKWQPYLSTNLGLVINNFGIGGTKISGIDINAMNNDARINSLADDAGLILIMGGTNDWAQNVIFGAETSIDVTTFNGALNVLIEKILNKYHTNSMLTKILFIGTPYGEFIDYKKRGWSSPAINNIGLGTKDYSEAIRKRCFSYNLPFCNPSNLGWNNVNIRDYITDDGALLHPSDVGGKRLAEIIAGKLRSIEPLV